MTLAERHIIRPSSPFYKELDQLCFLSKNVYNSALYAVRQHFFGTQKYLAWVNVNNNFVKEHQQDYYALPCKVSQQTIKLVDQNMRSFFGALKTKNSKPRLPKYLHKANGRYVVVYTSQAISHKELLDGYISLSKTSVRIKTDVKDVRQVRVVPQNGYIVIEVLYEKGIKDIDPNAEHIYCGIDLGLNNLITCAFADDAPLIINGKPIKSANQWYNKERARLQSLLTDGKKTSERIKNMTLKRNNKISDYLHKASRMLVNHLTSKGVTDVVIGYNKEWKQGTNMGKVSNQNFVGIPYYKLLNMLKYKCALEGIALHVTEENYTSKCSFLDCESVEKHDTYMGRRVKRGLFVTNGGKYINADVNGALNIIRKVAEITPIGCDLVGVCSTPMVYTVMK